ncbi:hypothetical protein HOLleu_41141 [Holothuria leucospilota]|uniref:GIY-YIG domain-containing protein n=1 Tax=Holothuria leucospilota TaxID=206669 RepID=A0A9Q0YG36_HOLLE|nr:hypothetical protein HOLleu_41141 [Holothuria leucospilota]
MAAETIKSRTEHVDGGLKCPFKCDSANVVYLLFCNKCSQGNYIGETKTPFRLRFNNHKQTIRSNSKAHPVAVHFNLPSHSLIDLKVCIIKGYFKTDSERKAHELKLIRKVDSRNKGLNKEFSHLGTFSCLH